MSMEATEVSALWGIFSAIRWALLVLGIVQSFNAGTAESATMCKKKKKTQNCR